MILKQSLLIIAIILGLISGQAMGLEVDVSSSGGGTTTQMSTSYDTTINDFVVHDMLLTPQEGGISNHQHGTGGTTKSVTVTDPSNNKAQSYAKVVASDAVTTEYWVDVNPAKNGPGTQSEIWLTVENAKSISAWSKASSSDGNSLAQSSVSINSGIDSPTTLASLDYWSKAFIDSSGLHSEQQAYPGRSGQDDIDPANAPPALNGASGDRVIFTETAYDGSGHYAISRLDARDADVPYYNGESDKTTNRARTESWSWTLAGMTDPSLGSISAYSRALDSYVKSTGAYVDQAKSSTTLTSFSSMGLSILDYHNLGISNNNGVHTDQQAYSGSSLGVPGPGWGAWGGSITFNELALKGGITAPDGYYASSYLNAREAAVQYYNGKSDTSRLILSDPDSVVLTESWSQTQAGAADPSLGSISAYSQTLDGYQRATTTTPSSSTGIAKSSVSINPVTNPPTAYTSPAFLDYYNRASIIDSYGMRTDQQAFAGANTVNPGLENGASGNRVIFTEISYDSSGDYALSKLDAKEANVPYYMGMSIKSYPDRTSTEAYSQTSSTGGISAYSQALDDYAKASGTIPSSYSSRAKSATTLTGASMLDYYTNAGSESSYLSTGQDAYPGVSYSPNPYLYGATGDTVTFTELSDSKEPGSDEQYASSSLNVKGTAVKAIVPHYNGGASVTTASSDAHIGTYIPSAVTTDNSITYQMFAKDESGNSGKAYASVTGSGSSLSMDETAYARSGPDMSYTPYNTFIGGLSLTGNTVSTLGDTTSGSNRYYLQTYASGLDTSGNAAHFSGDIISCYDNAYSQQNIAGLAGNAVWLRDFRNGNYVTLTPLTKSFSGTATSYDTGHIIQDNVNLASSGDKLTLSAGTFTENVVIDKSLKIYGAGKDKTIVDGNHAGSVFFIQPSVVATIASVTIQGGTGSPIPYTSGTDGGGIDNVGILTVTSCRISGNTASNGGGISSGGDGSKLTVINSEISGNTAIDGDGGGIVSSSPLTVTGSTLLGNTATYGGGILTAGIASITSSTISGNKAFVNKYGTPGWGGGIFNGANGKLTVTSSTISGNTADTDGGGIFNNWQATVTVKGNTISGNTANSGAGGGIINVGKATITGNDISWNTAAIGGGIYNGGTLLPDPFDWSQVHDNNPNP